MLLNTRVSNKYCSSSIGCIGLSPNRSLAVLLEYWHMAKALHNHVDVGLGPSVLAHLYRNFYMATTNNPLNVGAPGAFWMIYIWLHVYFPELRSPSVILLKNQVMALPIISATMSKRSIKEYVKFFRHCKKRSASQWQVILRRNYP